MSEVKSNAAAENAAVSDAEKRITVTVKQKYRDKNTRQIHVPGETLTISESRYQELTKDKQYVEKKRGKKNG